MTSILISKPPKQVANILNVKQSVIIFKTAPKEWVDYLSGKTKKKPEPMDVYIYCTQSKPYIAYIDGKLYTQNDGTGKGPADICLNGKVVAKFTLKEVELLPMTRTDKFDEICKESCMDVDDMLLYFYPNYKQGYAWHISDLQIFDKPKELSDFYTKQFVYDKQTKLGVELHNRLDRAPQSWCYVEEKE